MSRYNSIIVLGPTASGKTKFAVQLAHALKGEIISIDSRQVYQRLDIGTGKDYADYHIGDSKIRYHLIDLIAPTDRFNVFDLVNAFGHAWDTIQAREHLPILCGGTGLYYDMLLKKNQLIAVPVNERLRQELKSLSKTELEKKLRTYPGYENHAFDFSTDKRLVRAIEIMDYLQVHPLPQIPFRDIHPLIIGMKTETEVRRKNISVRLKKRLEEGMIEEARKLIDTGVSHEQLQYFGLEYKFLSLYLQGKISFDEMFSQLETAIHQYARRQMTWFRKMEREGFHIHWMQPGEAETAIDLFRIKSKD